MSSMFISYAPLLEELLPKALEEAGAGEGFQLLSQEGAGIAHWEDEARLKNFLHEGVHERGSLVIRHLFPVQISGEAESLKELVALLSPLQEGRSGLPWSIQTRVLSDQASFFGTAHEVNDAVVADWGKKAYERKGPEEVLSLALLGNKFWAGLSKTKENISSWPGGQARYFAGKNPISRAKKKLMEAFDIFQLSFSNPGAALDLGAAPGGWSEFLLEEGWEVTAVDPARLDRRLRHPRLRYVPELAEDFVLQHSGQFDLVVADMKMDAIEAAELLVGMRGKVSKGGLLLSTLKLPKQRYATHFLRARSILERAYKVRTQHLFHNRHELTVTLSPK